MEGKGREWRESDFGGEVEEMECCGMVSVEVFRCS
jgi:hypothetical protein